jgi:hypothetical protein
VNGMSDNLTMDNFMELTPEQTALREAMEEIREAVGMFKNKTQADIRKLRRTRRTEYRPSKQASLDNLIVTKEKELSDVDCIFQAQNEAAQVIQDRFKLLIKWDEIMRKHGVAGC